MSEYGYRPGEGSPTPSWPDASPADADSVRAAPYALQQSPRYPDPQRSDFQPYSGPYSQPYSQSYESRGYPAARTYPGPQPYPGGQGYGLQAQPPYPTQPDHPQAGTVLALGVVGIFVPVVSFVAWYLGSHAEHEIEDSGVDYTNSGALTAGKILGMIVSILQLAGVGLMMIWIVFAVLMAAG